MPKAKKVQRGKGSPDVSVTAQDLQRIKGLARRTKAARLAAGFTNASQFALYVGVSKQYLRNIEHQKCLSPQAVPIAKIARGLNVTIDWLLTGAGLPGVEALDIQPQEFDLLEAYRAAKQSERATVVMVLNRYLKIPGKTPRQ